MLPLEDRVYPLDQLKLALPDLDLIGWLSRQTLYPKVYWKERGDTVVRAAVGSLFACPSLPSLPISETLDIRFYGGMCFSTQRQNDQTWKGFPQTRFWLPQIEVSKRGEKTEAILNSLNQKFSFSEVESLNFSDDLLESLPPSLLERQDAPDFSLWQDKVNRILEEISQGRLDKLVLARKTSLLLTESPSPWPILAHLTERAKQATVFAFQISPSLCFLGATPERLFHRELDLLKTEALAGTCPRGQTPDEDLKLEQELLSSPKELKEFKCVSHFLESALQTFSEEMAWEAGDRILKASHVQHIYNRLTVKLKPEISDAQLIHLLHPTPAIGGFPREEAMSLLKSLEPFDRGWYGAPVGIISPSGASFYVAIRSALMRGRSLHLFAGTGLVDGSIAEKEWEELEQKIRPFIELF